MKACVILLALFGLSIGEDYSFAVISDIHIGDSQGQLVIDYAISAVAKINSIAAAQRLKFVFVTGDLANSGLPWQYEEVRSILDQLVVPYIPTLGNHDMWQYNDTWEEPFPTGDALFQKTFLDKFSYPNITKNESCHTWNPVNKIYSCFQNWELRVGNQIFLSLDWNSRHHAVSQLGYKGSMPTAELHDFPGGTLPFLKERLAVVPATTTSVVLLQHHPFRGPPVIPSWIYSFSEENKLRVEEVLRTSGVPNEKLWGVIAGHFHMWWNSTAYDFWPSFWQWETDACKVAAAFTLAHVSNNRIVALEEMYG